MSSDSTKHNRLVLGVNFIKKTIMRKRVIVCVIVLDPALGLGKLFLKSSEILNQMHIDKVADVITKCCAAPDVATYEET